MTQTAAALLVIGLGLVAANLPFLTERLLLVLPPPGGRKRLWLRFAELAVWYVVVGVVAYLLERRLGNVFAQGWEFYAITLCLFLVFAYPGFVYRYLRRHHG